MGAYCSQEQGDQSPDDDAHVGGLETVPTDITLGLQASRVAMETPLAGLKSISAARSGERRQSSPTNADHEEPSISLSTDQLQELSGKLMWTSTGETRHTEKEVRKCLKEL